MLGVLGSFFYNQKQIIFNLDNFTISNLQCQNIALNTKVLLVAIRNSKEEEIMGKVLTKLEQRTWHQV